MGRIYEKSLKMTNKELCGIGFMWESALESLESYYGSRDHRAFKLADRLTASLQVIIRASNDLMWFIGPSRGKSVKEVGFSEMCVNVAIASREVRRISLRGGCAWPKNHRIVGRCRTIEDSTEPGFKQEVERMIMERGDWDEYRNNPDHDLFYAERTVSKIGLGLDRFSKQPTGGARL